MSAAPGAPAPRKEPWYSWFWDAKVFCEYLGWGFGIAFGTLAVMLLFQKLGGFCGQ